MLLVCLYIRQLEALVFKILPKVLSLSSYFFLQSLDLILTVSRFVEAVYKDTDVCLATF